MLKQFYQSGNEITHRIAKYRLMDRLTFFFAQAGLPKLAAANEKEFALARRVMRMGTARDGEIA